jgi:hypothetical protein
MFAFGLVVGAGVAVLVMHRLQDARMDRHYLAGYRRGQRDANDRSAAQLRAATEHKPRTNAVKTATAEGEPARVTHARVARRRPRH